MYFKRTHLLLISLLCIILLTACKSESTVSKEVKEEENKFELAVREKNQEIELVELELTSYGEEIGAELSQPSHASFAINQRVMIDGTIEQPDSIKGNYAWIKIYFSGETLTDNSQQYYIPIEDGNFKQEVTLSNGEGKYSISILLPSKDREDYYYDIANFEVFNVNPNIEHEIVYSPFAQDAQLKINNPDSGFTKGNEELKLNGTINLDNDKDSVMLKLTKDGETWKHVVPVVDGEFTYDVPLFYGKGIHELTVYVPSMERDNYYEDGTVIYIDNESDLVTEPIEYMSTYEERGLNLEFPDRGGAETELTYPIKGTIDKDAPFAKETTHLYITTRKDDDEALAVIPVNDYTFDDEFHLRFGPGTYEVIVSVPEIKEINSAKFSYQYVAKFSVTNIAPKDQRNTLPSRGVQSDAPEINEIAFELMDDAMSDRDKALAVYEYTAKTIFYDVEKLKTNDFNWDDSALKTLDSGTGVCQDYAYLALAILRAGDMEARYIAGTAGSGFNFARHAWVEVKVNDEWITMDPTWGAGYIDNNEFIAKYTEDYFEPDEEAFKTHSRTGVEY